VREGEVAGKIPARLMRVGFVGEWGYEIHVPASMGGALWDALMQAGKAHGIRPFGVEAQRLLRLEKGHIIISQDTDGLTTPLEVGMDWAVKMNKPFFVGQRSLAAIAASRASSSWPASSSRWATAAPCRWNATWSSTAATSPAASPASPSAPASAATSAWPSCGPIWPPRPTVSIRLTDGTLVQAQVSTTPFYDPDNLKQKEAA
jgi:sarcosine oxidase subunit alpha